MKKELCYVGIAMHPKAGERLEERYSVTQDESRIGEARAAVCYGIPGEWTLPGRAEKLVAIGCHSCGEREREWIGKRGIKLTLADSLWRTVAEHTLGLMMAVARSIPAADREIRAGGWKEHVQIKERFSGFDFQGKTLGILGMGQIGRELADMVRGFRMQVLYYDTVRLSKEKEMRLGISFCSFDELMKSSDYLTVLVPLTDATSGMLDREAFAMIKKGCILINTARAGILDEDAFLEALDDGTISGAGLDVFWEEGCTQRKELVDRENVVMTPHLGGSTFECDMVLVEGVLSLLS